MSIRHPLFRPRFVDRITVLSGYYALPVIVVVTKSDLAPDASRRALEPYARIGCDALHVSIHDEASVAALRSWLTDKRSLVVGQSGVGKSSLINEVCGHPVQKVNDVSVRWQRGRHTTTAGVLLRHDTIEMIDTPGLRELDCRHVPAAMLGELFTEIGELSDGCSMPGCTHREEPGCAVRTAVDSGTISGERYESYLRLFEEIRRTATEDE
jgi:ribosome biogenesis GTPase